MIRKYKITYGVAALLLFLSLFLFTFCASLQAEKQAVQIVVFGDSCYGNVRDESSIVSYLEALSGKTVYNAAFGGTCVSRQEKESRLDYSGDSLSLVALAEAVYADDFGVQQTIRTKDDITAYFTDAIDGLENIDFSKAEIAIIGHGVNDYCVGALLDNEKDRMDERSFAGALRKSITLLKKANPDIRIIMVTPTYCWMLHAQQTCEEFDGGGGPLEQYVETEMAVAQEFGAEVIDLYHDFYPHGKWEDWELYTFDGVHPNEDGRSKIAKEIAEYLEGAEK